MNFRKKLLIALLLLVFFSIGYHGIAVGKAKYFNQVLLGAGRMGDGVSSILTKDIMTFIKKIEGTMGIIFTVYTIFIASLIFMENKNPSKTIAWLLILFLVPIIGFIFYLFLGQNVRKKNIFKKKRNRDFIYFEQVTKMQLEAIRDKQMFIDDSSYGKRRLISLILKSAKAPLAVNNRVTILTNGAETFESIIGELKRANHHIHLEYFIIKEGYIGDIIKDILVEKAKAGVKVRVLYDSVGSWRLSKTFLKEMEEAGVEIHGFLPVYFPILSRELNYRNHRKIIVIDGRVGFVGGINIGDEYLGKNPYLGFWRDTHIKIHGEAVYELQNIFLMDWLFVTKEQIDFRPLYFPKLGYCGEQLAQITASGPDSDWESIMQAYFSIISSAEEYIWINTPYLVPDDSIMMALKTAALSGVDVRIILPDKPDHKTVFWASMANIEELLMAGVKIYKYKKGFIHAKILLVDDSVASVGTANLDIRSFEINFEVNAFIYDKEIVKRLRADFLIDIHDSMEVNLDEHLRRPLVEKIKESAARLFSPLL